MPVQLALDLRLPLIRMRLDALVREFFVDLQCRIVQAQFDDGEIRRRRLEVITEAQVGELKLGLVEIGKRVAEVDQHEVALVSDEGVQGGLAWGMSSPWRRGRRRLPARWPTFRRPEGRATRANAGAASDEGRYSLLW